MFFDPAEVIGGTDRFAPTLAFPTAKYGQEWIRTTEGVKPADLQSCSIGEFDFSGQKRPKPEPSSTTLEQLQEMLVCAIVGKQLPAIDSTIEYVIPTVLLEI